MIFGEHDTYLYLAMVYFVRALSPDTIDNWDEVIGYLLGKHYNFQGVSMRKISFAYSRIHETIADDILSVSDY